MNEGHVGHLKILQQSKSCICEDFNFGYDDVGDLCCSNFYREQIGARLPDPALSRVSSSGGSSRTELRHKGH